MYYEQLNMQFQKNRIYMYLWGKNENRGGLQR